MKSSNLTKQVAVARLRGLRGQLTEMKRLSPDSAKGSAKFSKWRRDAEVAIEKIFGEDSRYVGEFADIYSPNTNLNHKYILGAKMLFESMIDEIELYWPEDTHEPADDTPQREAASGGPITKPCVFIGHGRSPLWARLQLFLEKQLGLDIVSYESEPRAGESIISILEKMLEQSTFAVLILTAEDETASGNKRPRQNVVHEAGLFQGRLGFKKAILLRQEGTEDFSNVAGLQCISFSGDKIEQTFWELREVLLREGQISEFAAPA